MNKPFLLSPSAKDYLWGGRRLNDEFGKNIDLTPLAETWECSTHPDGPSVVASGMDAGRLLTEVLQEHPEYLGSHVAGMEVLAKGELPILIKFIDASRFDIQGQEGLRGFLKGLVAANADNEIIYIDSIKRITKKELSELSAIFSALEWIEANYDVEFILTCSGDKNSLPDFIVKHI